MAEKTHPVGTVISTELMRVLTVIRVLLTLYVVWTNIERLENYKNPTIAIAATAVLALWSGASIALYHRVRDNINFVLTADLAVTVSIIFSTTASHSQLMLDTNQPGLASYWACTPILAAAIVKGASSSLAAALAVSLTDLYTRTQPSPDVYRILGLLCLVALMVGYMVSLLNKATVKLLQAEQQNSILKERTQLARTIHDGVVQTLALTTKTATRHGHLHPEIQQLASEAKNQETNLRNLIQSWAKQQTTTPEETPEFIYELQQKWRNHPEISISGPSNPIELEHPVHTELLAAVSEAVCNTQKHAPQAQCWILVEYTSQEITVTIRDNGPGFLPQELNKHGHVGISQSIQGRIHDLGGKAELYTDPSGTEWELSVPLNPERAQL